MACENPCDCPINKFDGVAPPTANDDNCDTSGNGAFCEGSLWRDTSTSPETWYIMTDSTCTNAQWDAMSGKETLTSFRGFVASPPQTIPPATPTNMDVTEDYNANPADIWDNVAKTFTVKNDGRYLLYGSAFTVINNNVTARWSEGAYFQILVDVNGSFNIPIDIKQPIEYLRGVDNQIQLVGSFVTRLNANDIVTVKVSHRLNQDVDLIDEFGTRNLWGIERLPDYQPL